MVSSKCCAVVSPSPLRFFAALMPPCAHTECERFTGTMENRSTFPPASAILITAESPANPPPMTMILGFRFAILLFALAGMKDLAVRLFDSPRALRVRRLLRPLRERYQSAQPDRAQH